MEQAQGSFRIRVWFGWANPGEQPACTKAFASGQIMIVFVLKTCFVSTGVAKRLQFKADYRSNEGCIFLCIVHLQHKWLNVPSQEAHKVRKELELIFLIRSDHTGLKEVVGREVKWQSENNMRGNDEVIDYCPPSLSVSSSTLSLLTDWNEYASGPLVNLRVVTCSVKQQICLLSLSSLCWLHKQHTVFSLPAAMRSCSLRR